MITIGIENFRGCASAKIECAPIALVGGKNAAGKSSLAQGVGGCLSGKLPASGGLPRNPGNLLVRTGAGSASIEVSNAEGVMRMIWPTGQASQHGSAPSASEWATGLDSVVNHAPRDRARVFSEALHAEPTEDDLTQKLLSLRTRMSTGTPRAVWSEVQKRGWDGAHGHFRERGAELKGMWEATTGARYGSRIAAAWRPDLADLDEGELERDVRRLMLLRDRAIAASAVSHAERDRVETEASKLQERRSGYEQAEQLARDAQKAFARARDYRASMPPAAQQRTEPCPYCDMPLVVEGDLASWRVKKASGERIDDGTLKKRRLAIADADGTMSNAEHALTTARRSASDAAAKLKASEDAQEKLEHWPRAVEHTIPARDADEQLTAAQKRLGECRAKKKADELHATIEAGEMIIDVLAGDGLRAEKLAHVLGVFNDSIEGLSHAAGWRDVTIGNDMVISYADRPYALLSDSEKFRVRVVLQVAMAKLEGASLVVVDAADILDGQGRSGLIGMLGAAGIPALVCLTLSRIDLLPDLAAARLGASYWIEGGQAAPLQTPKAA